MIRLRACDPDTLDIVVELHDVPRRDFVGDRANVRVYEDGSCLADAHDLASALAEDASERVVTFIAEAADAGLVVEIIFEESAA